MESEESNMKKFRLKPKAPEGYMTVAKAAEFLGVSSKSIRRYIHNYGLPATKPGGLYLIRREDLERWARENG